MLFTNVNVCSHDLDFPIDLTFFHSKRYFGKSKINNKTRMYNFDLKNKCTAFFHV